MAVVVQACPSAPARLQNVQTVQTASVININVRMAVSRYTGRKFEWIGQIRSTCGPLWAFLARLRAGHRPSASADTALRHYGRTMHGKAS